MGAFGNQVALVTGASRGIGNALALALAAQGATLALVGRDEHALGETAAQARATSPHVESYIIDLTNDEAVRDLKARVDSDFGDVDILVHGAGVIYLGDVGGSATTEFDEQLATNVRAPYVLTKALLPTLRRRRGQVVFVNSSLGLQTRAAAGPYAATKHALKALADTLRDEVNGDGVRVLSVYPGRTATPGQAAIHALERRAYIPRRLLQPEDVASIVVSALALPRSAEVTDIRIRPMHKS
jgi:NADP-dependent 3-hydroxy acid dehydrogenase YdfG